MEIKFTAKNLLENADFEEGIEGWNIGKTGSEDTPKIVSDVKYEGNNSMYFVDGADVRSDFMPVTQGRKLKISGYFKGENIVLGAKSWHKLMSIGVWYDSAKKDITSVPTIIPHFDISAPLGTFDWTKFENVREVPAGAAYYRVSAVGLIGTSTGKGWADKLEVVHTDAITITATIFDKAGIEIWSTTEDYDFENGITHTTFAPDLEEAKYIQVGIYDLEEAAPITVTVDDKEIAVFEAAPSDTWQWTDYIDIKKDIKKLPLGLIVGGVAVAALAIGYLLLRK